MKLAHGVDSRHHKTKLNITLKERKAIRTLVEDEQISIKEAYKGGAVVIKATKYYKGI